MRCDKTNFQRFEANQARLKMGVLAYNLLLGSASSMSGANK